MTPDTALAWLESLARPDPRPWAERAAHTRAHAAALLAALGHPEYRLAVIHVTGSKGKGSTALYLEAILRAAGLRVGTFTSPHLRRWAERIRIDGAPLADAALAECLGAVRPAVEARAEACPAHPPRFFEVLTAAAIACFAREAVDVAVVEAGLGGRRDATAALSAAVAVLTSVELEHTAELGDTLAAIAGEKAGIFAAGRPAVLGRLPAQARAVVEAEAARLGVPLARLGEDFTLATTADDAGLAVALHLPGEPVITAHLPTLAGHLADNAALAAAAVAASGLVPASNLPAAIAAGLAGARLPGRCELVSIRPWVVVDGAHTAASARALAALLARLAAHERHLLLSLSAGKDWQAVCDALMPGAARVTATCAAAGRSLPAAELAARLAERYPGVPLVAIEDPAAAYAAARAALPHDAVLAVTGSVYMAGIASAL